MTCNEKIAGSIPAPGNLCFFLLSVNATTKTYI